MLSFKQFDFSPGENFMPSKETKNFWLYTKKRKGIFGGVVLPGLFETIGYSTQIVAFFAILALEIIPTVYGIREGVLWQAISAAIFVDIFLAIVSHLWHDKLCLRKNELVNANREETKEDLRRKINKYNLYTYIFYVLILLSGILKFYFFYDAYMTPDAIAGGVLICYLLGSILHISYTGYFVYTSRFNYKIQLEYSKYISHQSELNYDNPSSRLSFVNTMGEGRYAIFPDGTSIEISTKSSGNHSIIKMNNGNYELVTSGILTDKELAALIFNQPPLAQGAIARKGVALQLETLNS